MPCYSTRSLTLSTHVLARKDTFFFACIVFTFRISNVVGFH